MGIGGAALASVLGMVVQVTFGGSHFFSRKNGLKFIKPKHVFPSIATNYGAGQWDRIKGIRRMSYLTIAIMGTVFSLSGILFPLGICGAFVEVSSEIESLAQTAIRTYFIAFLPMGINLLSSYYLQSVLSVKRSLCISLLRNIILSSVAILTFPLMFDGNSLWFVMPVVEVVVLFVSILFVRTAKSVKD